MDVAGECSLYDEVTINLPQKGETYAHLDYRNSAHTMAAWIFRPNPVLWDSPKRQCDSYIACYCPHSHRFEIAWDRIALQML